MASKREQVLDAVLAMVRAALPNAEVERNVDKAERPAPGGNVIISDGDPGEPEIDYSPLSYNWQHRIGLSFLAYNGVSDDGRAAALDEMFEAVGDAMAADRTLGGLVRWLDAEAPAPEDLEVLGAESGRWADLAMTAEYSTKTPLN